MLYSVNQNARWNNKKFNQIIHIIIIIIIIIIIS